MVAGVPILISLWGLLVTWRDHWRLCEVMGSRWVSKLVQLMHFKYSITCYSKFSEGHVLGKFEGKTYNFTFPYQSPWKWLESVISDPDLAPLISWYPVQKFLIIDGKETRLYWWTKFRDNMVECTGTSTLHWWHRLTFTFSLNCSIKRTRTLNVFFPSFYGEIRVTSQSISRCILWYFEQHFCWVAFGMDQEMVEVYCLGIYQSWVN